MNMNTTYTDQIYESGTLPPLGCIPRRMHAWTIRQDRLGDPLTAFRDEIVELPALKPHEVLVANVSVGINYNGIWAARGAPKNVLDANGTYGDDRQSFHICGSEASGIVYATGEAVSNVRVGDPVILSASKYDPDCPWIRSGGLPEYSPTYHMWGYEGNWGAFAQFSKVSDYQCVLKPSELDWDEAAVCCATGTTVNRMLCHWDGNRIRKGDVVLIWGGAGGLGTSAIQQTRAYGGIPIAVVAGTERGAYCKSMGAAGYIDRTRFTHWGSIAGLDEAGMRRWSMQAARFRNEIYEIAGGRINPAIVLEHPGGDTLATSLFVCAPGGMVVLCGATTGYLATVDLRHLWIYQKRIQGSHAGSPENLKEYLRLRQTYDFASSVCRVYPWDQLPNAHKDMEQGTNLMGKFAVRILPDSWLEERNCL